jgi:cytochrome b561
VRYSRFIRWSHALTAVAITFQLAISLIMDHPHRDKPMTADGGLYFRWHEWAGLAALAILACWWVYSLMNWKRESQSRLFPWVASPGRSSLLRETGQFLLLRWTKIAEDGALVGTIHGLGFLITSAMAITGGILYVALGPQDTVSPTVNSLMKLHSFLATFMWVYLGGHALMALWHEYMGHGSLARIFKL